MLVQYLRSRSDNRRKQYTTVEDEKNFDPIAARAAYAEDLAEPDDDGMEVDETSDEDIDNMEVDESQDDEEDIAAQNSENMQGGKGNEEEESDEESGEEEDSEEEIPLHKGKLFSN